MPQKMLVVAAHMGDFVWRSGGAIAKYAQAGHEVHVVVLSYGLRGEAKNYWMQPNANLIDGAKVRREEGVRAAKILGVSSIEFYEYEDYVMEMNTQRLERLAGKFREFRPDFIITHDKEDDVFNPDHNLTSQAVLKAYNIASGAGAHLDGLPVSPRQTPIFGFEPHNPEACSFKPGLYIDITCVMDRKIEAIKACASQAGMLEPYIRKAETRGEQCRVRGCKPECRYAEAFSFYGPIANYGYFVW